MNYLVIDYSPTLLTTWYTPCVSVLWQQQQVLNYYKVPNTMNKCNLFLLFFVFLTKCSSSSRKIAPNIYNCDHTAFCSGWSWFYADASNSRVAPSEFHTCRPSWRTAACSPRRPIGRQASAWHSSPAPSAAGLCHISWGRRVSLLKRRVIKARRHGRVVAQAILKKHRGDSDIWVHGGTGGRGDETQALRPIKTLCRLRGGQGGEGRTRRLQREMSV